MTEANRSGRKGPIADEFLFDCIRGLCAETETPSDSLNVGRSFFWTVKGGTANFGQAGYLLVLSFFGRCPLSACRGFWAEQRQRVRGIERELAN